MQCQDIHPHHLVVEQRRTTTCRKQDEDVRKYVQPRAGLHLLDSYDDAVIANQSTTDDLAETGFTHPGFVF